MATGFPDYSIGFVGAITVPNGGTGLGMVPVGSLLTGNGLSQMTTIDAVAAGEVLISEGLLTNPAWSSSLPIGSIVITPPDVNTSALKVAGFAGSTKDTVLINNSVPSRLFKVDFVGNVSAVALALDNALGVASGGTGASICTAGQLLIASGFDTASWSTPDGCKLRNSTTTTVTTGTPTILSWDTEVYNNGPMHSTSVNPSRITCRIAGKYLIIAHVAFDASGVGSRRIELALPGPIYFGTLEAAPSATDPWWGTVSAIYNLGVGDYVYVTAYQSSGGNLTTGNTELRSQSIEAQWLGP